MLQTFNLTKKYGPNAGLHNLNMTLKPGCIVGVLGPNGAGKSTLIRLITQIIMPDSGSIHFHGKPMTQQDLKQVGYLPEERGLYKKMKVGEHLLYLGKLRGFSSQQVKNMALENLNQMNASDWWNQIIENLSKGMQQKVQFIAALMHKPRLAILDEPFSGFDPLNSDEIMHHILQLKQQGTGIMLSTHRMETVEALCDEIYLLNRSRLVMHGNAYDLKKKYSQGIFRVQHHKLLPENRQCFELIQTHIVQPATDHSPDLWESHVKPWHGHSTQSLLEELNNTVQITSFSEHLPGFNDLFKQIITQHNHSSTPQA